MMVKRAGFVLLWLVTGGGLAYGSPAITIRTFANAGAIQILDDGPASPYPSTIDVTDMPGVVTHVAVTLHGLSHVFPDDIDIVLVTPSGQKLMVMSDAGGSFPIDGATVTFEDGFPLVPNSSQISTATYSPTNWGLTADTFPAPIPAGPYLIGFNRAVGYPPTGAWSLYVFDDALESVGSIAGGWSLTLTTTLRLPEVSIRPQGSSVVLTWPTVYPGFTLSETPILNQPGPISWTPVTNAVIVTNLDFTVATVPVSPGTRFFKVQ